MTTNPPSSAAIFDDAECVRLSLAGNREAFEKIVAQYQSLICSLTYSATGSLRESEDVAQETFLTAWRRLKELRETEKLRPWLCGIARHLISNTLRRQEREPTYGAESLDDVHSVRTSEASPSEAAINREEAALLWRSLERIPELYREPLILFYREHHSTERVAAALNLSEETARQRLSRGRKLLQEEVTAFVEGALQRSAPGLPFTTGVLSALPTAATSAGATALATSAKGGGILKAAAMGVGILLIPLGGLWGSYLRCRLVLDSAPSDGERWRSKKMLRRVLAISLITQWVLLSTMIFGGKFMVQVHPWVFVAFLNCVFAILAATLLTFWAWERRQRARNAARACVTPEPSPRLSYRSRISFLGLPLVNLQFGNETKNMDTVRGWIAGGGRAIGGLFAFGPGVTIAPIAISCGPAIGLLAVGPFALGALACGPFAEGWEAAGGWVVGWKAALGGSVTAREFAVGGTMHALHAGDAVAQQFFRQEIFFRAVRAMAYEKLLGVPYLIWCACVFCILLILPQAIGEWRRRASQQTSKFPES
jgi:RNA polymerase sigma factor (sigma-70 family)